MYLYIGKKKIKIKNYSETQKKKIAVKFKGCFKALHTIDG